MALRCDLCGKSPVSGNNVSHSKRHTKRRWMPNLRTSRLTVGSTTRRVRLCTRCLRTQNRLRERLGVAI